MPFHDGECALPRSGQHRSGPGSWPPHLAPTLAATLTQYSSLMSSASLVSFHVVPSSIFKTLLACYPLSEALVGGDHPVLFSIVLDYVEVSRSHVQLRLESITNMLSLGVMVVALKPTHRCPGHESITVPLDVTHGEDEDRVACCSGPWITGVGRHGCRNRVSAGS